MARFNVLLNTFPVMLEPANYLTGAKKQSFPSITWPVLEMKSNRNQVNIVLYVFIDVRLSHLNKDYLLTYLSYNRSC